MMNRQATVEEAIINSIIEVEKEVESRKDMFDGAKDVLEELRDMVNQAYKECENGKFERDNFVVD